MKKLTKDYAEGLADKLLEKLNGNSTSDGNVTINLENGTTLTKDYLVNAILSNDNIYIPFKRTIQFDNLQDETVKTICKPAGEITMTETFNKGYTIDELLSTDLTSLDVHCEGVKSKGAVSFGIPYDTSEEATSSNIGKYYSVTYTGKSSDGTDFSANAIYNSTDPTKKEYYISKDTSSTTSKKTKQATNIVTSTDSSVNSTGFNTTKDIKIGNSSYSWNHYEGSSDNYDSNTTLYTWKDSISENSGRIITNATCSYANSDYSGVPVEFTVNDFSTGSTYKEENGIIKSATGSLSLVCKYNKAGNVVLEKPTFDKTESASIISTNLSKIDSSCVGIVSVTTNSVTNTQDIVITPNYSALGAASDVSKIVDALKKWNVGSGSDTTSWKGNNIWINTSKGNYSFSDDGSFVINNYVSLSDYFNN